MTARVLGVDACRTGWVGVSVDRGDVVRGWTGATIGELVERVAAEESPAVIAIDIPIGLPADGPRQADLLARDLLGVRRSSVFATLVRSAYEAETFQAALAAQVSATGKGMSQQAWGLRRKVLDVDGWLAAGDHSELVVECHPEVSFAAMNGGDAVPFAKKTWAGQAWRRELLADHGIVVPADLGAAGEVPPDDVLDAAAAAWTARRVATGRAGSIPDPPERLGGRVVAITY